MRLNGWMCGLGMLLAIATTPTQGQNVFGGGSTAFDPQISVVNTGAILDARPVVSHDMRYVTITARPTVSQLVALRQFPVPLPANLGFVGSIALQNQAMKERGAIVPGSALPTPSPLDKRGMTKLD